MSTGQINRIQNGHKGSQVSTDLQGHLAECQTAISESVRKNPLAATLVVFGVGFSVGSMIGGLIADSSHERREHLAKSLGRRMLNSVADYAPDNMQKHLRL